MFPKPPTEKIECSKEFKDWLTMIGLELHWKGELDANGIIFYELWKEIQELKK